ncbi:MAG: RHS repeat-associated core domain-containing protein [Pseudomonadota bacterium]
MMRLGVDGIAYNLRYAGQYFDSETGLHESRYRYYDPKTGRYLTPDPIGLAGGMHRYNYVSGDPINKTDATGLCPLCVIPALMVRAAIVGGVADASIQLATRGKIDWWQVADTAFDAMFFGLLPSSPAKVAAINKSSASVQACAVESAGSGFSNFIKAEGKIQESLGIWPPHRGAYGPVKNIDLGVGTVIDRYGSTYGTFTAPVGTSFGARALPGSYETLAPYNQYNVINKIENVTQSNVLPWFGQTGKGVQYELPNSV